MINFKNLIGSSRPGVLEHIVTIDGTPVWDYKAGPLNTVYLISEGIYQGIEEDYVTLGELRKYIVSCKIPFDLVEFKTEADREIIKIIPMGITSKAAKLITLLIVLPFFSFSQVLEIETKIYKVLYDQDLEQPLQVNYTVLCPEGGVSRGGMDFRTVPNVHTSDDEDYANNVWDKGHLAPAAAFNCSKEMLRETFLYFNCALQHESLNRGVWNRLEQFERNLANFYKVEVEIKVQFDENIKRVPTGAAIPKQFTKTIKFGEKQLTFIFPNKDTSGTDWIDYLKK